MTEAAVLEIPEAEPLAVQLHEQTNSLAVIDEESKQRAGQIIVEAKARINTLEKLRKEEKEGILAAGRACDERWNARKRPYEQLVADVQPLLTAYVIEEQRIADAARREAEEKAEKERQRIEALARENERKAQEAREREEKARRDAEVAAAAGDEAARKAAQAEADKAAKAAERQEAKADAQMEQAATVPAYVPPPPTKVAGMAAARPWKATCTDLEALLGAAVNSADPTMRAICRGMLKVEFSQQAGNRQAAMTKNAVKVPGVSFAQDFGLRGTGR